MRFDNWQKPEIEHGKLTKWNWVVYHPENLKMGNLVDIGAFTYINCKYGVTLGDNVQIGSSCSIYSLSTIGDKTGEVIIEDNVNIGSHCTVMPGVKIGRNSTIGAHSFVNKDVPENVVAFGVPLKVVKEKQDCEPKIDKISVDKENKEKVFVPLSKPDIGDQEISRVTKVLKSGILSLGNELKDFEQSFSELVGTKYAVGVNSGTSALHLCIRSLNIQPGDEIITSPFSFIASANCILYENAIPVFVDVEEDSFNINPDLIEAAITPRTKAILVPHIFGQSCNMTKIMEIARRYNLKVIEDACESINATHYDKKVGSFGDVAVFAFYPNKQITTGEGGMIVTSDQSIYEYCKSAVNQGRSDNMQWLTHDKLGYNYRMDEMSAALGVVQVNKIESLIKKRQEICNKYLHDLNEIEEIILPKVAQGNISTWFVFPIRVNEMIRDQLIKKLNDKGVQSKAYFFPCIHLQPFYREKFGYQEGSYPVAEKLSKQTLILPLFPGLNNDQLYFIKESLKQNLYEIKNGI